MRNPISQLTDGVEKHPPRAFVIGWPISHSKSPLIHGHWLNLYNLAGSYEKIAVEPDKLAAFIADLKETGYAGGNVTIPHKEAVLEHVDVIHDTARRLGAANTLWFEGERLHADNTDGYGFLANLDQGKPGWDQGSAAKAGKRALVLGAGGASRPIVDGLITRGFDAITIVNRTRARAEEVASHFAALYGSASISAADWEKRSALCEAQALLVNTTALGMSGQATLDMDLSALPKDAVVTDIVYTPLKTDLLQAAEARGNAIIDGLGMLLHQAVPGFEAWFGKRPDVTDALRKAVLAGES